MCVKLQYFVFLVSIQKEISLSTGFNKHDQWGDQGVVSLGRGYITYDNNDNKTFSRSQDRRYFQNSEDVLQEKGKFFHASFAELNSPRKKKDING